ncbi:MAG: hypothetical protein K6E84_09510 [Lachnospiraceae bacterium]|nr:hypothetical protein [Lachnospiraceae bacterium]
MNLSKPEGSMEAMDMIRICHVACMLKKAICPKAGFSPLKGGEDLEAAIRQFGLLHRSGEYFLMTENIRLQEELKMMTEACEGMRVSFNNGKSRQLILPDPDRLWNGYCRKRYAFGRKNAGAALMGAWVLAAAGFRLDKMREGYFLRPDPIDGYLIASLLWFEAAGLTRVRSGLNDDPLMYLICLSYRLCKSLKGIGASELVPADGRGGSLLIKGCDMGRVSGAIRELSEQMKGAMLHFYPADSETIVLLSDPPDWRCFS